MFFVLRGGDVVKLILGNVDKGNVLLSTKHKVRKYHTIHGPVANNHNVVRRVAQVQGFFDTTDYALLHGDIPFSLRIDIMLLDLCPFGVHMRHLCPDFLVTHTFADSAVDLVKFCQGNDGTLFLNFFDG